MRIEIPSPSMATILEKSFSAANRKELILGERRGIFSSQNIRQGLGRIAPGGTVFLPEGSWAGFSVEKAAEVRSLEDSLVTITSTIEVQAKGVLYLRGVTVRPAEGTVAIRVRKGTLICEDCDILAPIESEQGHVYLENCLLTSPESALTCRGGSLEVSSCRILGRVAGILAQENCHVHLFHNRIEKCQTDGEGSPGAGVLGEKIRLFVTGTEFFHNGVGTYLRDCPSVTLANNFFHHNSHAAIVSMAGPTDRLLITNCRMEGPQSQDCARMAIQGGSATIHHTECGSSPSVALSARDVKLSVAASRFASTALPAVEVEGGQVSWKGGLLHSTAARAMAAWETSGEIAEVTMIGAQPSPASPGDSLNFVRCIFLENGATLPSKANEPKPLLTQLLSTLDGIIGQSEVKQEMTMLLRRAFMEKETTAHSMRKESRFHGLVSGPHGCGKLMALETLGEALARIGTLRSPRIRQITLADLQANPNQEGDDWGILFVRARVSSGISLRSPGVAEGLYRLCQDMPEGTSLLLEGDRDALALFMRANSALGRLINFELHFAPFNPPELAAIFVERSRRDAITLDHEAARKLPLLLHFLQERMQRKFGDLQSIEDLYLAACHKGGTFEQLSPHTGFVMTAEHLETPVDKLVAKSAARSPAFAVICPSCQTENPWIPGLPATTCCLHCETPLGDQWGIWKNSTYFRKRRTTSYLDGKGSVAKRRIIQAGAEL